MEDTSAQKSAYIGEFSALRKSADINIINDTSVEEYRETSQIEAGGAGALDISNVAAQQDNTYNDIKLGLEDDNIDYTDQIPGLAYPPPFETNV